MIRWLRTLRHGPLRQFSPFWIALGRKWRSLLHLFGKQFSVSHRIGPYGPFSMDATFAFSDFSNWGGAHNEGFAACVEACRNQSCVIDVGAHIGLVTLPAASVLLPGGKVVAFEPASVNRAYLQRHIALNGLQQRVAVEPCLVGAEVKDAVPFFELDEAAGKNTTVAGLLGDEAARVTLPQITLDDYCERNGLTPSVIKIDVEGAEIGVLQGARDVLSRARPLVILSVHPRQIATAGGSLKELWQVIEAAEYDCRQIDGSPVETFALREYRLTPRQHPEQQKAR